MESAEPPKLDYATPEEDEGVRRYYREPPSLSFAVYLAVCMILFVMACVCFVVLLAFHIW